MYKEAQRHRSVLPAIAQHLLYCIALQFVSMRWVRFHSQACVSMRRRSSSHCFLLTPVQCLSISALKPAPATACPFTVVRVHASPCAPMPLNSRPCGSMRPHASFSGTPVNRSATSRREQMQRKKRLDFVDFAF